MTVSFVLGAKALAPSERSESCCRHPSRGGQSVTTHPKEVGDRASWPRLDTETCTQHVSQVTRLSLGSTCSAPPPHG